MRQPPFTLVDSDSGEKIQTIHSMNEWDVRKEAAMMARGRGISITIIDNDGVNVATYSRFGARIVG